MQPTLPSEGFVRLETILKVFPIGKSTWNQGVREGKYPKPKHLGPKLSVWSVNVIRDLIKKYETEGSSEGSL